jgi:hypothetical protein
MGSISHHIKSQESSGIIPAKTLQFELKDKGSRMERRRFLKFLDSQDQTTELFGCKIY